MTSKTLKSISLVTLRKSLGDIISRVNFTHDRTLISRNGKSVAAIVPVEDLELLESLENRADIEALRQARREDDGTRVSLEEFLAEEA